MSDLKFTKEQLLAINTKNSDILVAAAAGSGKTAVLVQRIIRIILDKDNPVDIDKLLVVTFTEAAASEMKQRISAAIAKELLNDPDNEHLQKQIVYLNKAQITTIHSFCLSVIRQNFHLIDIDPAFRIADQTEIRLLKREVISALFEEEYLAENNQGFLDLVETYGNKLTDDALQELTIRIANFMESSPWPEKFIYSSVEEFNIDENTFIDQTIWGKFIKEEIFTTLNGILETIKIGEEICKRPYGPENYLENFYNDHSLVKSLINMNDTSLENIFNQIEDISFSRLKAIKKTDEVSPMLQERAKTLRNSIKKDIEQLSKNFFFKSPKAMKDDIIETYPVMKSLGELVLKFAKKFDEQKKDKNIVDFNDLEHYCLSILLDANSTEENPIATKKAIEMQSKYYEIFIDEYQDSNLIQELILWSVSKNIPKNRFMVGDIKQSIYKFRRANPDLFIDKYESFSNEYNGDNLKIDLSKNFRSRQIILSSINFIFYQIMSKTVGEISYDDNQALYFAANYKASENVSTSTELHLIDQKVSDDTKDFIDDQIEEYGKIELEAKVVATRIEELVSGKNDFHLEDKNGTLRPAMFKDIVILVRSIASSGEIFIQELKKYNIPVFANTSEGFWNSIEVLTVLSFLQIIDNPIQDLSLLSVLHSPVYSLENEELLEIRNANKETSFYSSLKKFVSDEYPAKIETKEKCNKFLKDLSRWRKISIHTPISELIGVLYEETDYFNYIGVMPGGLVRQGNLHTLQEKAIQYETTSYKSLFHFIKYIERLQDTEEDSGGAKVISENDNVVKMMTIHKSKGLEFPIVFVSQLGKLINLSDMRQNLILHSDLGFGPTYVDLENRTKTNTIARTALARKLHQENLSEELRVLYVALTRAEEKLILTGVEKNIEKKLENWTSYVEFNEVSLPTQFLLKSRTFLDFIVPAISRHGSAQNIIDEDMRHGSEELYSFQTNFQVKLWSHDDMLKEDISDKVKNIMLLEKLQKIDINKDHSGEKQQIIENLSYEYPYNEEVNLPSNISISEIKRNHYELELVEREEFILPSVHFEKPDFIETDKKISSVERGTAIHTVMEHIDLNYHNTTEKINSLIAELTKKFLSEEEAKVIPVYKMLNFVNSEIAERMRNAKYVKREEPFVMGMAAEYVFGTDKYKDIGDELLVHGIIDCFFEEDGNIILVDYKSDYITNDTIDEVVDKYKLQLSIYKQAIEESTKKQVSESHIYFFGLDDTVKVF